MLHDIAQVFVPVDFSRSSRAAVALARGLTSPSPAIELTHVIDPLAPYVREVLFPFAGMGEDEVELERELGERAVQKMEAMYEVGEAVLPVALVGERDAILSEAIARSTADVVVMGAFGQGGAVPENIGSTAARVLRSCARPVILVRALSERTPKIERVLCALDLTPASHHVLSHALNVAMLTGAQLETLFVLPDPLSQDPNQLLSSHVRFDVKKVMERERHKLEALFERTFNSLELPFGARARAVELWRKRKILFGEPAETILEHASQSQADLIVLGTRSLQSPSNSKLGRVCWHVTRSCTTHVMTVPMAHEVQLLSAEE